MVPRGLLAVTAVSTVTVAVTVASAVTIAVITVSTVMAAVTTIHGNGNYGIHGNGCDDNRRAVSKKSLTFERVAGR